MRPMTSAITGALRQVETAQLSVGREPGSVGAGQLPTVSESAARDWLVKQDNPVAVDRALQTSLQSSLGVEAVFDIESRYPKEGGYYNIIRGVRLDGMTPENRAAVLAKIRAANTPASRDQIENWLVALQAACAGGRRSEEGATAALDLYAGAFCRYPADVVKSVCMKFALRHPKKGEANWFPSLGEMDAEMSKLAAKREAMLSALGVE